MKKRRGNNEKSRGKWRKIMKNSGRKMAENDEKFNRFYNLGSVYKNAKNKFIPVFYQTMTVQKIFPGHIGSFENLEGKNNAA